MGNGSAGQECCKGTDHQEDEAGKNKDVENPRSWVAGMLPLSKPKLGQFAQAGEGMIEAVVGLRTKERDQSSPDDISEARGAQDVNGQEEDMS